MLFVVWFHVDGDGRAGSFPSDVVEVLSHLVFC